MTTYTAYVDYLQDDGSIHSNACAQGDDLEEIKWDLGIELQADLSHGLEVEVDIKRVYVKDDQGNIVHEESLKIDNVVVEPDWSPNLIDIECEQCHFLYSTEVNSKASSCPKCGHVEKFDSVPF